MIALLRKDAPWLLFCLVGGLVGLTIALVQDGPLQVFVLRAPRLQGGFHTSWIAGMLLGGIAGGFDELLGTREFLQQRPIAASRLALSRLLGCGLVLMTWMLVVPVLAWTWAQLFDDHVPLGEFGGWPQWLATNSVAWSACGIGLCAASLPLRGPVRLLLAFLLFWSAFLIVHLATRDVDMSELAYGLGHALVALATGGVAWVALQMGRDADRPPVAAMRAVVVPMLVTAAIVGANCCIVAWQAQAVSRLQVEYPQPKQVGREVVLVSHPYSTGRRVVGPDHQPIERALGTMQDFGYGHDWRWLSRDTEFEEPNWGSLQSVRFAHGRLWQGVDGRHWMEQHGQRARLVTRDGAAASVAPTIIKELGPLSAETAVLLEPGATAVWRFVPERSQFVEVPTPDGGRVREFGALRNDQLKGLALPAGVPIGHDSSWFRFVRGDSANYALVGEALQVLPTGAESAAPTAMAPRDEHAGDPLEYTITVPTS